MNKSFLLLLTLTLWGLYAGVHGMGADVYGILVERGSTALHLSNTTFLFGLFNKFFGGVAIAATLFFFGKTVADDVAATKQQRSLGLVPS